VQATRKQRTLRHVLNRQENFVTIGIAAPCHNGELILMSADMRGTYDGYSSRHELIGKQFELISNFWANTAGDPRLCNAVINIIIEALTQVIESGQQITYQHVRDAMISAQVQELMIAYDNFILNELNMTRQELRMLALSNPKIRRKAKALYKLTPFDVELSVCGFVFGQPLVVTLWGKQKIYPEIEFSLVGDGWSEAHKVLDSRSQHPHMSIQRTLVHFSEAMAAAKAQISVGEPADYVLLHKTGVRRIPSAFADKFASRYAGKDTQPLDANADALKEVMQASYTPIFHKPGEAAEGPIPDNASLDEIFKKEND
jgi:hypothetical protein